jgi:hypothetical protein
VEFLEQLVDVLFRTYDNVHSSRRFQHARSWLYLLVCLAKRSKVLLQQLLERTIFAALAISILPSEDPNAAPPGMRAEASQKEQPCETRSALWIGIKDIEGGSGWLKQSGRDNIDPADHDMVASLVYKHMFQAAVAMIDKLDLALESGEMQEEDDSTGEGDQDDAAEHALSQAVTAAVFIPTVQASGMSGLERPRCQKDVDLFLNLVLFFQLVTKDMKAASSEDLQRTR